MSGHGEETELDAGAPYDPLMSCHVLVIFYSFRRPLEADSIIDSSIKFYSFLIISRVFEPLEVSPFILLAQDQGSRMVNETLGFLITKAISSTFVADCDFNAMTTKSRKSPSAFAHRL